jgi:hypothetical protein
MIPNLRAMVSLAAASLLILGGLAACAPPAEAPLSDARVQAIRDTIMQLGEAADASVDRLDCGPAIQSFADTEPLFVSGGRVIRTRDELATMCEQLISNRTGAEYGVERTTVHVLSPDAAYMVREGPYTIHFDDGSDVTEYLVISDVWQRLDGTWKRVHFHESARDRQPTDDEEGS